MSDGLLVAVLKITVSVIVTGSPLPNVAVTVFAIGVFAGVAACSAVHANHRAQKIKAGKKTQGCPRCLSRLEPNNRSSVDTKDPCIMRLLANLRRRE